MAESLATLDAWWRAADCRTVGQVSLASTRLRREPVRVEQTPARFDVVVPDGMSRYHLWHEMVRRVPDLGAAGRVLGAFREGAQARYERWVCERHEDMPEVRDWTWTAACGAATQRRQRCRWG